MNEEACVNHNHDELVHHNQKHFDDKSSEWDDDPEVKAVSNNVFKEIQSQLTLDQSSTRVLNFGCGTGLLEQEICAHVHDLGRSG